jgi:hypothetical protein
MTSPPNESPEQRHARIVASVNASMASANRFLAGTCALRASLESMGEAWQQVEDALEVMWVESRIQPQEGDKDGR